MEYYDVFKGPFTADEESCYIFCNNGEQMCFDVMDDRDAKLGKRIADLLNDAPNAETFDDIGISDDGQYICNGYQPILCVRGWGYLNGALKLGPKEAVRLQNDFVKWAANQLCDFLEPKVTRQQWMIDRLKDELEVMKEFIEYIRDNYGDQDRKVTYDLCDVVTNNDCLHPVGWLKDCWFCKMSEKSQHQQICFTVDGKTHSAEWYPDEGYAVCQYTEFEDSYHGYILLPELSDVESDKDLMSCYCFYYEC